MSDVLHEKYRPQYLKEVIGQEAAITAIISVLNHKGSRAFLFTGPSGVGKTTLARIVAFDFGCNNEDIVDFNAALHTGVDDMREILPMIQYKPFGEMVRAIIIDEAHRLSGNAWDSILKPVEEPPAHIAWFFCTTNAAKVPQTIKTRCTTIALKLISEKDLGRLYDFVCEEEKIDLPSDIGDMIIREAHGSARQLLVNLAACRDVTDKKLAADILRSAVASDAVLEICRFLTKGGSWPKLMALLDEAKDTDPESIRIVISRYFAAVVRNAKSDDAAGGTLELLDAFSVPYNQSDGPAQLMLSLGRALFRN